MKTGIPNGTRSILYGHKTIEYSLFYCDRKTLEIAVHPDCFVIVKAPITSGISLIEKKLHKRAGWILKQQDYFRQFIPKTPDRCYVMGETHLYLGKQYRLKLTEGVEDSIKLTRGFFHITYHKTPTSEIAKNMMNTWYLEKAHVQYQESVQRCWQKFSGFDFRKPNVSIKRMKKRWGSLSEKGTLTLNTDLIRAPKECIDYVVTHELCHLKSHDHGKDFYSLLESVMPNWKNIKHKLELSMV